MNVTYVHKRFSLSIVATKLMRSACRTRENARTEMVNAANVSATSSFRMGAAKKSQRKQNLGKIQNGEVQIAMNKVKMKMSLMCKFWSFDSCLVTREDEMKFTIIPLAKMISLCA